MGGIFISYRREDTAGHAGRIFDRLKEKFGQDKVFMDVSGIEPGIDFVEAIDQAVGSCDALLVIIGKKWIACTDASGKRRLDDPKDFIRLETSTALRRDIRVIPVLVQDAAMPGEGDLPDDLKKLARRQATEIDDTHWDSDTSQLIETLVKVLPEESEPAQISAGKESQVPAHAGEAQEIPAPVPLTPGKHKHTGIMAAIAVVAVAMGIVFFINGRDKDAVPDDATRHARPPLPNPPPEAEAPSPQPIPASGRGGVPAASGEIKPEAAMVVVPDVTGLDMKKALAILKEAGLNVEPGAERVETTRAAPGAVLRQSLKPGLRVGKNVSIKLAYAVAPRESEAAGEVSLPDFTGSPVEKVEAFLREAGLVLGAVKEKASSEHPAGTVIAQRPPATTRMEKGGAVTLMVAVSGSARGTLLSAPEQTLPEEGQTLDNYPRTTALRWKAVSGAAGYAVELDCLHCCVSGKWCSDLGRPWKIVRDIDAARSPGYKFEFAGAQSGRWRVWAVDKNGREGEKSPWRTFRYTR